MRCDVGVVVVDDDEAVRSLIVDALGLIGCNVVCCEDGASAWRSLKAVSADLIISDIHMEGMNGLDLLVHVKTAFPEKKCIIISGDPSRENSATRLGADVFLLKPFAIGDLMGAVLQLCEEVER
jgi:two-component system nitrogen regulation response regulator GlnG